MKLVRDRVSRFPNRIRLVPTGKVNEYDLQRADNPIEEGTKIDAKLLRGIYGMENSEIIFNEDGSIIEYDPDTLTLIKTTFKPNGSILEEMKDEKTGRKIIKETKFKSNGNIEERIK